MSGAITAIVGLVVLPEAASRAFGSSPAGHQDHPSAPDDADARRPVGRGDARAPGRAVRSAAGWFRCRHVAEGSYYSRAVERGQTLMARHVSHGAGGGPERWVARG